MPDLRTAGAATQGIDPLVMILITLHLSYTNKLYIVFNTWINSYAVYKITSETVALRLLNEHASI